MHKSEDTSMLLISKEIRLADTMQYVSMVQIERSNPKPQKLLEGPSKVLPDLPYRGLGSYKI